MVTVPGQAITSVPSEDHPLSSPIQFGTRTITSDSIDQVTSPMVQTPIDSGFAPVNTASDVIKGINLTGKVAIVTGGYAGLGLEVTKTLLSAGATVIIGVRTPEKAAANLSGLSVEVLPLDLIDPASIDSFASAFLASSRPLHLLINNAAIMSTSLVRDSRGYEGQFATNHLGHFQLTARLWPALAKAGGARVVCLSAVAHLRSPVCDDWNFETREYDGWQAYGQSKTANCLFARGLDARGAKFGVRAFSVHPGLIVATTMTRIGPNEAAISRWVQMGMCDANGNPILDPLKQYKSVPQGASTTVWAATSPLLEGKGGLYLENNNIAPLRAELVGIDPKSNCDPRGFTGVADFAIDLKATDKLWELSERLTGAKFAF
jgi:NAD(P)-dependent dehydrogenase (short-subunit alcohol dehydrogenase family)